MRLGKISIYISKKRILETALVTSIFFSPNYAVLYTP